MGAVDPGRSEAWKDILRRDDGERVRREAGPKAEAIAKEARIKRELRHWLFCNVRWR